MMQRPRQTGNRLGLFWYDEFEIETMDTPMEVYGKLAQVVGEVPVLDPIGTLKKRLSLIPPPKPRAFIGTLSDEAFHLSFESPRRERIYVNGTINASGTGATIQVKIQFRLRESLLKSSISLVFLILFTVILLGSLWQGIEFNFLNHIFLLVIALVAYISTALRFWESASYAKNALLRALR